ncbi:MAG: hypothetical protein ACKPJJ_11255, partial [Planctomycetaceae bacterium]
MLWPNKKLVKLFLLPALLSLAVISLEEIWPVVAVIDGLFLAVLLIDLATLLSRRKWLISRSLSEVVSIGKPTEVSLTLENLNRQACMVEIVDFLPEFFENPDSVIAMTIPAKKSATIRKKITPLRRGRYEIKTVQLLISSQFGLWTLEKRLKCRSQ